MPIKINNITYTYMIGTPFEKKALDDVSLEIKDGEIIAIIGHTGSGKSTLIQHMNGLLKPDSGSIFIDDIDITLKSVKLIGIRKKVGLVFQYPEYQLFEETIEKDIGYGPRNLKLDQAEVNKRVIKAMNLVGLDYEKYKDKSPFEISGGQKRRVAIAGIIAMEPKILILDEPTAGLDPAGRDEILKQIKLFKEEYNMTIIMVSHSMEEVAKIAERVIVMDHSKCILDGSLKEVFREIDTLESVGLAVPQITYLAKALKDKGFIFKEDIFTVKQAKNQIIGVLRGDT
ncbi:MAG TPA: energy-coupling factor transporter ATPase [Clostridiaceae bacterium]